MTAAHAEKIADRLIGIIDSGTDEAFLRAFDGYMNRKYGKPTEKIEVSKPAHLELADLDWDELLAGAEAERRRAEADPPA